MSNLGAAIAEKIRVAREADAMTQGDLADLLGVTRALISSIENGRSTLTLQHLEQLPLIFNRPLAWFLVLEDFDLSDDEIECLASYRRLSPAARRSVRSIARILAEEAG